MLFALATLALTPQPSISLLEDRSTWGRSAHGLNWSGVIPVPDGSDLVITADRATDSRPFPGISCSGSLANAPLLGTRVNSLTSRFLSSPETGCREYAVSAEPNALTGSLNAKDQEGSRIPPDFFSPGGAGQSSNEAEGISYSDPRPMEADASFLLQYWLPGVLALNLLAAALTARVAKAKGYSGGNWFIISIFSGIIGLIAVAGLPVNPGDLGPWDKGRTCPRCFRRIHPSATRCPFCTSETVVDSA